MNILLGAFFIITLMLNFLMFFFNLIKKSKIGILNLIAIILLTFSWIKIDINATNKIYQIGEEIDNKKVIGYEDRIILIEEEGGIKIPWYVQVYEQKSGDSYWVSVTGGSSIFVCCPNNDKKYSSLMY